MCKWLHVATKGGDLWLKTRSIFSYTSVMSIYFVESRSYTLLEPFIKTQLKLQLKNNLCWQNSTTIVDSKTGGSTQFRDFKYTYTFGTSWIGLTKFKSFFGAQWIVSVSFHRPTCPRGLHLTCWWLFSSIIITMKYVDIVGFTHALGILRHGYPLTQT